MRALLSFLFLAIVPFAGCLSGDGDGQGDPAGGDRMACDANALVDHVYWFAAGHTLVNTTEPPAGGSEAGNGFAEAFLTNDLKEWLSNPVTQGLHLQGDVILEFWAENVGTPAPIVIGGEPGEGYHFFNQFGSNRSLQPAYAVEYATVAPMGGSVSHYNETLTLPEGGFVIERGDKVRVLLTSLVLDDAEGSGHDILYGGDTPSSVRFSASCYAPRTYPSSHCQSELIHIVGNQGLLTGAIPARDDVNQFTKAFEVEGNASRISIDLRQEAGPTMPKQDIDATILDAAGSAVWPVGSPYTDEHGVVYEENIKTLFPPGTYAVQVDSYSGTDYEGRLTICVYGESMPEDDVASAAYDGDGLI